MDTKYFLWSIDLCTLPLRQSVPLIIMGFLMAQAVKESACHAGDLGSIPGLVRSFGEENSYPLQYSCLENSMDRGAWRATIHGVTKRQTQLSNFTLTVSRDDATHWPDQIVNIETRLIMLFAAKDKSQQKQDLKLTVVRIMGSLLKNSGLNWRK